MKQPAFLFLMACLTLVALRAQAQEAIAIPGIGVDLGVKNANTASKEEIEDSENFPSILYRGTPRSGGGITIMPILKVEGRDTDDSSPKKFDYLERLEQGGVIIPVDISPEYNILFPTIDFKVVNNSDASVHFTEAIIEVSQSSVDTTPLPLVFGGYSQVQYFEICNDGWGPIDSSRVEFNLVAKPSTAPAGPFKFTRDLGPFSATMDVDLNDELVQSGLSAKVAKAGREYREANQKMNARTEKIGVDHTDQDPEYKALMDTMSKISGDMVALQEKEPKAFGPFRKNCFAEGRFTYSWKAANGEVQNKTVTFSVPILLIPPDGLGAAGPITGSYQVMLKADGKNYTKTVPISQTAKKGDLSRFLLTLGVPCTSTHEFTVKLKTNDNRIIPAGSVTLHGFLPRTAAEDLKQSSEQ